MGAMDGLTEKTEDVTRGLQEFLDLLLDHTGLELDSRIEACDPANPVDIEAPDIVVDLSGPDADLLLEERNELLRAIESREVRPVGSDRTVPFKARILAATHRDLAKLSAVGQCREEAPQRPLPDAWRPIDRPE